MSELTGRAHVVEVPPLFPNQPLPQIRNHSPVHIQRLRLLKLIQQMTPPKRSPQLPPLDQSEDYTPYVDQNPVEVRQFSPYKPSRMSLSIKELQRYRVPHLYKIPSKKYDSKLRQTVLSESSLSIELLEENQPPQDSSLLPQPRCTLLMNMNTQLKNLPSYACNPRFTKTFELLEQEEEETQEPALTLKVADLINEIYSNTNAPTAIESTSILSREESPPMSSRVEYEEKPSFNHPSLIEEESMMEEPLEYKLSPHPQDFPPSDVSEELEESSQIPVLSGKIESFNGLEEIQEEESSIQRQVYQAPECETPDQKEFTFACPNSQLICRTGSASTKATRSPQQRAAVKCEEPEVYSEVAIVAALKTESKILAPSSPSSRVTSRRQSTIRSKDLIESQFLCESPQRRLSHYGMNSQDLWNTIMKKDSQKSPQICYSSGDSHYHSALGPSQLSLLDSYNREHKEQSKEEEKEGKAL